MLCYNVSRIGGFKELRMKKFLSAIALASAMTTAAHAQPVAVVAAEDFYGAAAAAIGGDRVAVTNIIDNPNLDPHDYEATPSTARRVSDARIVIYNGADYDPWMEKLLAATVRPQRTAISVAALLGRKPGDNPHLWYDPAAMPAVADAVAKALTAIDPQGADGYASRKSEFLASLATVDQKIAAVRERFAGEPVTASEPVFGYMAEALGLDMRNQSFQTAIMNDTEPSARDIAGMESDLKDGKVKAFFYNNQVSDPLTEHLLALARAANVPVVGVTETAPAGTTYVEWMLGEIDATEKALAGPPA
jgi:zinc/manganese transport system substrate-binding protein